MVAGGAVLAVVFCPGDGLARECIVASCAMCVTSRRYAMSLNYADDEVLALLGSSGRDQGRGK